MMAIHAGMEQNNNEIIPGKNKNKGPHFTIRFFTMYPQNYKKLRLIKQTDWPTDHFKNILIIYKI